MTEREAVFRMVLQMADSLLLTKEESPAQLCQITENVLPLMRIMIAEDGARKAKAIKGLQMLLNRLDSYDSARLELTLRLVYAKTIGEICALLLEHMQRDEQIESGEKEFKVCIQTDDNRISADTYTKAGILTLLQKELNEQTMVITIKSKEK